MARKVDRVSEANSIARGNYVFGILEPFFRREIVESIVRRDFAKHDQREVFDVLNQYRATSEQLSCRVHLAALSKSGGSLANLRQIVNEAKSDYRDVLMPVENARLDAMGVVAYAKLSEVEKDYVANEDLNQYLDWLERR